MTSASVRSQPLATACALAAARSCTCCHGSSHGRSSSTPLTATSGSNPASRNNRSRAGDPDARMSGRRDTPSQATGRDRPRDVEVPRVTRTLRILAVLQALALIGGRPAAAPASTPHVLAPTPPAGAISPNVQFVANIPQAQTAISLNFIGNTMFVSAVDGLSSYDVSDPANPKLLGTLPYYLWENEDVDVDSARHLLFISRDPRGVTAPPPTGFPYGPVEVYDVFNPAIFRLLSVRPLPTGHPKTCVAKCRWTWTGGRPTSQFDQHNWGFGRP